MSDMIFGTILGKFADEIEATNMSQEQIVANLRQFNAKAIKRANFHRKRYKMYRSKLELLCRVLLKFLPKKYLFGEKRLFTSHRRVFVPSVFELIKKHKLERGA